MNLDLEDISVCWCGSRCLEKFSPNYRKCAQCHTLISSPRPQSNKLIVIDDNADFYGKEYWLSHVQDDYGLPGIFERTRTDLPERCTYWLERLLEYRLPPAKTLELGCSHGGLVYLMKLAGFEAAGLELSPWICNYAKDMFDISMYTGRLEDIDVSNGSLDVILMMDVLEHLPDPQGTLQSINNKLTSDGLLVIQTPCYRDNKEFEKMVDENDVFLEQLKHMEHLYIFTEDGLKKILSECGFKFIYFEPQIFEYDMFVFASKQPITKNASDSIQSNLAKRPESKVIQALLDLNVEKNRIYQKMQISEKDRAARLEVIYALEKQLNDSERDRAARLEVICALKKQLDDSERDRAAQLAVIHALEKQLVERRVSYSMLNKLKKLFRLNKSNE